MSEHQHHGGVDLINRKVINECYRLNNIASMSISDGDYEEAIALLTKGLKQSLSFDCCKCYSLQSCFLIREEREEEEELEEQEQDYSMDCYSSIDKNDDDCYGFVYRKALRVNMSSSIEQQMHYYTGSTLRVIIVFNLALAYHLKAIATTIITATAVTPTSTSSTSSTTTTTKLLQQSLHLYMLAYRLHTEYEEQQQQEQEQESSSTTSTSLFNSDNLGNLRFVMIISNNIGEIHRISNDTTKHVRCLEHVLSCIMHTVVNFNNCSSNSSSISSNRNHQNHGHGNDYLHYSSFDLNGFHHNLSGKYQYAPAA
jgi:hypothetical protein